MLVKQRTFEITEKYRQMGHIPPDAEITQNIAHECILKEISATLAHRKRLHSQVGHLQSELVTLERANEQQKVPVATVKPQINSKPRKSRDHRSRSQDWPDVPDVGKIDEQNPELLAQKILETGRQIEAGKLAKPNVIVNGYTKAPVVRAPPQPQRRPQSPIKPQKPLNVVSKVQESPKVINFEDRLKSIITSVLNEDQEQRKGSRPAAPHYNGYVRAPQYAPPPTHCPPGAGRPRDFRRDRGQYERREPRHHDARHVTQPDYTQVSPAKLALRRHLSQERLAAPARTIGDLVNGEIERTLEISNQSIINAAINMTARYDPAHHPPLEGLAACLQARVLASDYWRGRAGATGDEHSPPDPHSNTSTPLADDPPDARPTGEGGEEVDESKWQDRIAFRFDQIISFASTAMEDKRRRSDEACNTSPDSGIGAAGEPPPAPAPAPRSPEPPHHFKKRFFRRSRWGAWSGAAPPPALDWERPPM